MSTTTINLDDTNNIVSEGNDNYIITGPSSDGNNTVTLGNGDDQITLGTGNNTLTLGTGTDEITAGSGNNTVTTNGSGTDTITLTGGNNTVVVGDGPDIITAGSGLDHVTTGAGDSTITLGNGADVVTTGNGNSNITVGSGAGDNVTVGTGSNVIALGAGSADILTTGSGGNTVSVAAAAVGPDTIQGGVTSGNGSLNKLVLTTAGAISAGGVSGFQTYQLANGGANDLTLSAANYLNLPGGVITVVGGDSNNTVDASALSSAYAVDVYAGTGTDVLTGGGGNDSFYGGPGTTSINGGGGVNTMTFYGPQSDYTVTTVGPTTTVVGAGSDDSLVNIQQINYSTVVAPAGLTLAAISDSGTKGDDITNVTSPVITGTGVLGDTITLFDGATLVGSGTVVAGDTWAITASALAPGTHSLTAVQTDPNSYFSAASTALSITIDTTIPAAPAGLTLAAASDSGSSDSDRITNVTTPVITGTGITGDTVALFDGATQVGSATVVAGAWSITTSALPTGPQSLTATQTDVAGNVSPGATALALTIDTTIPAAPAGLTLSPASDSGTLGDDITNVTTPIITGTGITGDTVALLDGATQVGSATVVGGAWSITTSALGAGLNTLTATQTDIAGNLSAASTALALTIQTAAPAAPAGLTLAPASDSGTLGDDITNVTTPIITGTGITGDTVDLLDGATQVGTATVVGGAWSITTSALAAGPQSLTAIQTDPSDNVSAASTALVVTIDTAIPAAPGGLTLAPASDSGTLGDHITKVTTPIITGTGVTGDTVALFDGATQVGSATVVGGAWSITTTTLAAGPQSLTAIQTDVAGNVSPVATALALTIDTAIPAAPAGLTLAPASDSGTLGDDITKVTTPVITGTGITGDTITLFNGATQVGSATVVGSTWSITTSALAAGPQTLTAIQTDVAGNVSAASVALPLTILTAIPAAPAGLTLAPASDSGTLGDDITNVTIPVITGTGIAGDTIALFDGATQVGTGTVTPLIEPLVAGAAGTWSITTTALAPGLHTLTATQTDVAGNLSAASTALPVTIVTAIPAAPTDLTLAPASDSGTLGDDITDVITPIITGTGVANDVVTLLDGATPVGTATVGGSGTWAITTTALALGAQSLTATQSDVAGNISAAAIPLALTIVPTVKEIFNSAGTLIGTVSGPGVQPGFDTTALSGGATTATDASSGSVVTLLSENNALTTNGNDTVNAGIGADTIYAAGPTTSVIGGTGSLLLLGGSGATTIAGGSGPLTVFGGAGGGIVQGGSSGDNVLVSGGGNTTLVGGGTGDVLVGGGGNSTLVLQAGGSAFAGVGLSTVFGAANSVLLGGSDSDVLAAGSGPEAMWAGTGSSTLFGGTGNDILAGGASGNATLVGGSGNNTFLGLGGSVQAYGGTGNDVFFTGSGPMDIAEGGGSDQVAFGSGAATVTAGSGTDLFTFVNGSAGGTDVIAGFKPTDQIQLFGYGAGAVQVSTSAGSTVISLSDGTKITMLGLASLNSNAIV